MAITFNAPQDRFGIQNAGSILAQALMQNATEQRQLQSGLQRDLLQDQLQSQRAMQTQQRQLELQQKFGPLLGQTLSVAYNSSSSPEQKNQALQSYLSAGGNLTDVAAAYKDLSQQNQTQGVLSQLGLGGQNAQSNINLSDSPNAKLNTQAGPEIVDVNTQQTTSNGNFYDTIDENTALALSSSSNPQLANIGKAAIESKKLQQSRFEADRKYESQRSLPYLKQIDDQRQALRNKEFALTNLNTALSEGNTGGFSLDNISRIFNRPEILSQSGAQQLASVKELLVSNISRVGARPNQWIEQQIASALPNLGNSKIANQTLAEAIRGEVELGRARIELTDNLTQQDTNQFGYVKGDIAKRVDKALAPLSEKIESSISYRMRELFEQEKGANDLRKNLMNKVSKGTPLTKNTYDLFKVKYNGNSAQAIENAKKLGYTILTESPGG